jgi:hypothetical protein
MSSGISYNKTKVFWAKIDEIKCLAKTSDLVGRKRLGTVFLEAFSFMEINGLSA